MTYGPFLVFVLVVVTGILGILMWLRHRWRYWTDSGYRKEYEHRAGLATVPTPRGERLPVPSDEQLRAGLRDFDLSYDDIKQRPDPETRYPSPFEEE